MAGPEVELTPLFVTDWTTGVDGAARIRVAQVVDAHRDDLAACFSPDEAARIEVTFGWSAGRAVDVTSDASGAWAECVRREVAGWRAEVKDPGPFTWEFVAPGPPPPPRSPFARGGHLQPPENGELQTVNPNGFRLVLSYRVAPDAGGRDFVDALESKLPALAACDLSEMPAAFFPGWFLWVSGRIVTYREQIAVGAGATCLEDQLRDLPMDHVHRLEVRVIPPPR